MPKGSAATADFMAPLETTTLALALIRPLSMAFFQKTSRVPLASSRV